MFSLLFIIKNKNADRIPFFTTVKNSNFSLKIKLLSKIFNSFCDFRLWSAGARYQNILDLKCPLSHYH